MGKIYKFSQDHNQAVMHRADYFKPFWESKKGNWELIYHDIEDIKGCNCMLTVKCLDCGVVIQRDARRWLVDSNQRGCRNCRTYNRVIEKVKALEARGFEVLSTAKFKGKFRIYTMRCPNCGLVFDQWGCNLKRWIKDGAKCPGCLNNGELPPDAVRIRKACIEARMTYAELAEKANYSYNRLACIASGINYSKEAAKYIADIAEEIARRK